MKAVLSSKIIPSTNLHSSTSVLEGSNLHELGLIALLKTIQCLQSSVKTKMRSKMVVGPFFFGNDLAVQSRG
jgi:hypothetical protein